MLLCTGAYIHRAVAYDNENASLLERAVYRSRVACMRKAIHQECAQQTGRAANDQSPRFSPLVGRRWPDQCPCADPSSSRPIIALIRHSGDRWGAVSERASERGALFWRARESLHSNEARAVALDENVECTSPLRAVAQRRRDPCPRAREVDNRQPEFY